MSFMITKNIIFPYVLNQITEYFDQNKLPNLSFQFYTPVISILPENNTCPGELMVSSLPGNVVKGVMSIYTKFNQDPSRKNGYML